MRTYTTTSDIIRFIHACINFSICYLSTILRNEYSLLTLSLIQTNLQHLPVLIDLIQIQRLIKWIDFHTQRLLTSVSDPADHEMSNRDNKWLKTQR